MTETPAPTADPSASERRMSPADRKQLRDHARKATPGPWKQAAAPRNARVRTEGLSDDLDDEIAVTITAEDAAYIAAAEPDRVLELIDEVEHLERERDEWRFDHNVVEHWQERAERAEAALRELVELKDGPRDDDYAARKPAAWNTARAITPHTRPEGSNATPSQRPGPDEVTRSQAFTVMHYVEGWLFGAGYDDASTYLRGHLPEIANQMVEDKCALPDPAPDAPSSGP